MQGTFLHLFTELLHKDSASLTGINCHQFYSFVQVQLVCYCNNRHTVNCILCFHHYLACGLHLEALSDIHSIYNKVYGIIHGMIIQNFHRTDDIATTDSGQCHVIVHNVHSATTMMFPSWLNITHNAIDRKLVVSHLVPRTKPDQVHAFTMKPKCTPSALTTSKQHKQ